MDDPILITDYKVGIHLTNLVASGALLIMTTAHLPHGERVSLEETTRPTHISPGPHPNSHFPQPSPPLASPQGEDQGQMFINISPCDENGKCMGEEYFVEESSELLGKPYYYKVHNV